MKPKASYLLAAGLILTITGCTENRGSDNALPDGSAPTSAQTPVRQPSEGYTLRPTDFLHVEMYMEQDFKVDVSVSPEGDIALPLIDRTHVAGKTLKEARQILTEKYKKYFKEPNLSIFIQRYAERKVYVDGFVNKPGAVVFPPEENMTISRAIAGAAGIQARGKRSDVTITRSVNGKIQVIVIDMDEVSSGRAPDIELTENDRIYVKDSPI